MFVSACDQNVAVNSFPVHTCSASCPTRPALRLSASSFHRWRWHPVDRLDEGLHGSGRSSVSSARRSQPFRASPLQRAMADAGLLRRARREAVFRLSLTLVAAALARGACALCHRVRVRALGAIMCAVAFACKPCCCRQSDHRSPSLRALCRRDDSTWSMTRRAPSEVARLFIVRFNMLKNLTSHSSTVSGRRASSSRLF
jgi:hypothetical protein